MLFGVVHTGGPILLEGNDMFFLFFLVVGIVCIVFAVACAHNDDNGVPWGVAGIVAIVVGFLITSLYAQDAGEVIVLRGMGGTLDGYTEEAGFHLKTPFQSTISYDVRNNLISLYRDSPYEYDNGNANGACVTVNDKGGASCDIDLQVVYSLDGDAALNLYRDYGTQSSFTEKTIINDVRAIAREVAGQYDTITMLTNRGEFTRGLRDALAVRWSDMGLNIEQVSVQDVRYKQEIIDSYTNAQAAEVAKAKALNDQETAKVTAETRKINAQGEADANRILTESLTPEVIQQHYIDTLGELGKSGNLVVVPQGSTPMVEVAR